MVDPATPLRRMTLEEWGALGEDEAGELVGEPRRPRRRHRDGRFVEILAASSGAHDVPGLDGLRLDLDALWSEVDGWPDEEPPVG